MAMAQILRHCLRPMEVFMKKLLQSKMGKVIVIVVGIVILLAIVTGIVLVLSKEESYRSMSVDNLLGTTLIANEQAGEKEAYKGMHLYSGDRVSVQNESNLTICLDADKYVYVEENTRFKVENLNDEAENRMVIHLAEGSVLNRLKKSLKKGESYTIETPNATMAVRGTVFRVTVNQDEDGLNYRTKVEIKNN